MAPIEGHQTPMLGGPQGMTVATVAPANGTATIPLVRLIEFLLQKTYQELTVLAELLPRKTDIERKIEIANFSHKVRQQFIRTLALIKWAASANKVEKCAQIMNFLDKQSMLFVETADMLSVMARETLVHARLPSFHLPAAVEVLTLGQYSRLPACIREKIVPPDPITPAEKKSTLFRLNQIIEYRLVSSEFPIQMKNLTIESGRVTFYVPHEFKACLTLMGDGPNIPWRLLDIVIQVEDKETGDGKNLVHSMQIEYLRLLCQSRLGDNTKPLHDIYDCLHAFCLNLQLEVLNTQAQRLILERLGNTIRVEEYITGSHLVIAYWNSIITSGQRYKLSVQADASDPNKPLQLRHEPPLTIKDALLAEQAIRSDHLSIEKLLMHTILIRSKHRLKELQVKLKNFECSILGSPPVLHVSLLNSVSSENLLITVDTHAGIYLAHVPQYEPPMIKEIERQLNRNPNQVIELLEGLKFWIMLRRCEKTIQHLPVIVTEKLPLYKHNETPLESMSKHRLYIKLCRHPNYYVIVELKTVKELKYSLMLARPNDEEFPDLPKCYLKVSHLLQLDTFAMTHGPCTKVEETPIQGKRKMKNSMDGPPLKKQKYANLFVPELAHVIAMCDAMLPFSSLIHELNKRGVCHQGIQVEANGYATSVKIVKMPNVEGVEEGSMEALQNSILSTTIQLQGKRVWLVEFVFGNCPIASQWSKEQGARRPVNFVYEYGSGAEECIEQMVKELLQDWTTMGRLYNLSLDLSHLLSRDHHIANQIEVHSYSYKKLILAYGPNKANTMVIMWKNNEKRFSLAFTVTNITLSGSNPHTLIATQLQQEFNQHLSIGQLIQTLNDTYSPLLSLSKLPSIPQLGIIVSRPNIPGPSFVIIPQTSTHYRIVYRHMFCLDIQVRQDGVLLVRDGAYSVFDKGKAVEDFSVIQMLKAFLSKSGDDVMGHLRRRSQSEDENPLSPGPSLETMDSLFLGSNQLKPGSPAASLRPAGLPFHMAMTPPSSSNPHTPASPHPSVLSQQQPNYGASPNPSFSLASPPSLTGSQSGQQQPYVTPSPSMLHMQAHSPGNLFAASSPVNPLHVPSPSFLPQPSPSAASSVPMPSPATFGGHGDGGSPFPSASNTNLSMSSPAAWPGSPSVPRPSPRGTAQSPGSSNHPALHSPQAGLTGDHIKVQGVPRVPTQRYFVATLPMQLSHKGLDLICSPSSIQHTSPVGLDPQNSPLERFMGCVFIRRHLHRTIQQDDALILLPNQEPGVIQFKVEALLLRVNFNMATMQALHLKATPNTEYKDQWSDNELQTLERYCDLKVLNAPYKSYYFMAFSRILNAPLHVLKSCINLIRLELVPDRTLKWAVQLCLTIPPSSNSSTGMTAVVVKEKMIFFLQLTRIGIAVPPGMEPQSIVLPIVYDINLNTLSLAPQLVGSPTPSNPLIAARNMLKRYGDYNSQSNECIIFPAIRDLMANLVVPL